MKKLFTITIFTIGLITITNAQGITNTLGGNTAADKFIVENSDLIPGLVITGEGMIGIGTTNPDDIFTISKTLQGAYGPETETLTLIPGSTERGNPASFVTSFPFVRFITPSNIPINGSGVSDVSFTAKNANLLGKLVVGDSGSLSGTDGSALFTGNVNIQGGVNMATTSGNVGIGTTNPLSKLSVGGDGNEYAAIYGAAAGGTGRGVYGIASNSGGMVNYGGYFVAAGSKGRGVYGYASNSGADTNYGGHFVAIGADGRGVYGYATGTNGQGVRGHGQAFDFYATGPGTDYGAASSIRWKRNIVVIDNPLKKLAELRGVYFDWDEEHGGHHDVGMIAEEVGKVLPEIVVYEENGIDADGMDYSKLTPLLVEAVKELQQIVLEQQARIEELENR